MVLIKVGWKSDTVTYTGNKLSKQSLSSCSPSHYDQVRCSPSLPDRRVSGQLRRGSDMRPSDFPILAGGWSWCWWFWCRWCCCWWWSSQSSWWGFICFQDDRERVKENSAHFRRALDNINNSAPDQQRKNNNNKDDTAYWRAAKRQFYFVTPVRPNNVKAFDLNVLRRNSTLRRLPEPIALNRMRPRVSYCIWGEVAIPICGVHWQKLLLSGYNYNWQCFYNWQFLFSSAGILKCSNMLDYLGCFLLTPPDDIFFDTVKFYCLSLSSPFSSPHHDNLTAPHQSNCTLDLPQLTGQEHRLPGELQQLHHLLKTLSPI